MRSKCCLPYYNPLATSLNISYDISRTASEAVAEEAMHNFTMYFPISANKLLIHSLIGCMWNLPMQNINIPARLSMLPTLYLLWQQLKIHMSITDGTNTNGGIQDKDEIISRRLRLFSTCSWWTLYNCYLSLLPDICFFFWQALIGYSSLAYPVLLYYTKPNQ